VTHQTVQRCLAPASPGSVSWRRSTIVLGPARSLRSRCKRDVSKETNTWLAAQPDGRFTFVFTPKRGSWLVEGFFSKMARSGLRRIRVDSKAELE
jgi:hypothetical protein